MVLIDCYYFLLSQQIYIPSFANVTVLALMMPIVGNAGYGGRYR